MIKNIIFDLGDVIVDYNPENYLKQFNLQNEEIKFLKKEIFGGIEWNKADRGEFNNIKDLVPSLCIRIPKYKDIIPKILTDNYADAQTIRKSEENWFFELYSSGFKMFIFSNTPKYAIEYLKKKTEIFNLIEGDMYSFEEGILKPDKQIYIKLLKKYNLIPIETVFIDDNPNNIKTANELGIHGIVFKNLEQSKKELEEIIKKKKKKKYEYINKSLD